MEQDFQITRSEFDSSLLSKEVAKVSLSTVNSELVERLVTKLEQSNFQIVMIKSPFIELSKLTDLPWKTKSFKLALSDIKLDFAYSGKANDLPSLAGYNFSVGVTDSELSQLKYIASQIALVSRFAEDYGQSIALSLYDQWVENLIKKETFFIARNSKNELAALIATTTSETAIDLALVAAHPDHAGKGLTKSLVNFATAELSKQPKLITVSTRVHNQPAIKLYEGTGFRNNNIRMDWTLTRTI